MKIESAQIRAEDASSEPHLTLVPKPGYAEKWELTAEAVYLYRRSNQSPFDLEEFIVYRCTMPSEETARALNSLLTRVRMKGLASQP